jgi:hypothetical protein
MYGTLDVAETIEFSGLNGVCSKYENPEFPTRGVKFNLPFEPYDTGDPFEKNIDTCLDIEYWCQFIDMLATNRYNSLSLWSEHPFHLMFKLSKFPLTSPYSDSEMDSYKKVFHIFLLMQKIEVLKHFLSPGIFA